MDHHCDDETSRDPGTRDSILQGLKEELGQCNRTPDYNRVQKEDQRAERGLEGSPGLDEGGR